MRNIEKYRNTFIDALDIEENDVNENLTLGEIREWDSIGHMALISEMEDVFDVSIDSEWITEFNSYLSGIELLKRLGVDFIND
ncbi:acyl carrier protein [Bacillus haimaensis]|uniref:acyl carrier protein n=1 Tax=Bacillus haimaensis TaxID=3160967 RepID=UPI003AA7BAF6